MIISNTRDLFAKELGTILDSEEITLQSLDEMNRQLSAPQLKSIFMRHREETQHQIQNLQKAFRIIGANPQRIPCFSAQGLVKEFMEGASSITSPEVRDMAVALAEQKVELLEVAAYRGLIATAERLGNREVADLLRENLRQEEQMAENIERLSQHLVTGVQPAVA